MKWKAIWKGSNPTPFRGQQRSPWLLTTYPSPAMILQVQELGGSEASYFPCWKGCQNRTPQWLFLVPLKGGIGSIVHPPISRKNTTYIPLIVLAFWRVICYLPSFRGTRNNHWTPEDMLLSGNLLAEAPYIYIHVVTIFFFVWNWPGDPITNHFILNIVPFFVAQHIPGTLNNHF